MDRYVTLAAQSEARIKIERSEFLGIAFPVTSEKDFMTELARIEKKHFDATHHCWAFRLFDSSGQSRDRSSDAGEPNGTAGKPIASAIEGAGLHDVGVVVVRRYGGVKLGTGGLSRAYRESASLALHEASREERYIYTRVEVIVPFERLSDVYRLVAPPAVVLAGEEFGGERNVFTFDVRSSMVNAFRQTLAEKRLTLR